MSTLKDVAKLANVNVSTVSRALNGNSYVKKTTKEKILNAVKRLNYHPNLLAKNLKEGKSRTIGVIVPSIGLNIFGEITKNIETECRKLGYNIIIANTQDDAKVESECIKHLRNGFVSGIVIASCGKNQKLIREINKSGIPIIQMIRKYDDSINSIAANYESIGYKSAKYLILKGCKNIGLINGNMELIPYKNRYYGYKKALSEYGYKENVIELFENKIDYLRNGYDSAISLIENNPNIDGILTSTDMQGIGIMRALKEKNIPVPKKIKLISLTGNYIGEWLETAITSMEIPAKEIGVKIANMIIEKIENNTTKKSPSHIIFEPYFVERETT